MPLIRQPLYQQLHELLRDLLATKEFTPGGQFLTERQIVDRFKVSRPTANKVLSGLVAEGLLEFRKGIGTFLREQPLAYDIHRLISFTEKATAAGRKPSTKVLSLARDRGQITFSRLRLADGIPVILERRTLPAALFPGLTRRDLQGSFYQLLALRYQVKPTESDQTIRAVNIRGKDADLLKVRSGAAGFLVSATGYAGNQAIWSEQTLYRGDAYEFHHRLASPGRLIGSAPAPPQSSPKIQSRHRPSAKFPAA